LDRIRTLQFEWIISRYGKWVGLAVLAVLLILLPLFVNSPYIVHLLIMVFMNSVLAMTFILLFRTGLITVAISAFWGIGAYASAMLVTKLGLLVWAAMPASAVISGIIALFFGFLLVRKGGIAFVILTMVLSFIMVQVFGTFDVFGGRVGIFSIPPPEPIPLPFHEPVVFLSKTPFYYLMLFLMVIVILVLLAFYSAWTGRAWRAIGLSPRLAESLGVNIFRYRLLAFVIGGAAAGLMGSFYAHYYWSIVPDTFGPLQSLYSQVYAILGGINFAIWGPIIGSAILTVVPEALRAGKEIEPIYTGIIVILLVMFLPDGLLGLFSSWRRSLHPMNNVSRAFRWIRASSPTYKTDSEKRE
jgi:branched-chain amino acid transport system permease protein